MKSEAVEPVITDAWPDKEVEVNIKTTPMNKGKSHWREFTDSTTLHGVRYLFKASHHPIRRLVWAVFVLGAVSVLIWQVGTRTSTFLQYNSNVNVETVYPDDSKVPLPAVTICNQNVFRVTAATKMGVYEFLDSYYGSNGNTVLSVSNPLLSSSTFTQMAAGAANQEDDLIEKCIWRGEPCSAATNTTFVRVYSDLGICYTINSGDENLSVQGSGTAMGLSLTLNVEQYEYMTGPNGDAGVKILLHDPSDLPQMADLGFSVAPGTHTLAAVKRSEVKHLPHPYGRCTVDAVPMSECVVRKRTEHVRDKCGCQRPDYMEHIKLENTTLCGYMDIFTCVRYHERTAEGIAIGQVCLVPCDRVLYDASLSYAQLSKFNINRVVLRPTPDRVDEIEKKLLSASETGERMEKSVNISNHAALDNILVNLNAAMDFLNKSLTIYSSTTTTTSYYGVGNIATGGADAIKSIVVSNKYLVLMTYKYTDVLCYTVYTLNYGEETKAMVELSDNIFDETNGTSLQTNIEHYCNQTDPGLLHYFFSGDLQFNGTQIINVSADAQIDPQASSDHYYCFLYLNEYHTMVKAVTEKSMVTYPNCSMFGYKYMSTVIESPMSNFHSLYEARMIAWYHETAIDPLKDIPEFTPCQAYVDLVHASNVLQLYDDIYQQYDASLKAANFTIFLDYLTELHKNFIHVQTYQESMVEPLFDLCSWPKIYNYFLSVRFYPDVFLQPEYAKFFDLRYIRLEQLTENFPQLERQFDDTYKILSKSKLIYDDVSQDWTAAIQDYKDLSITKLQLATFITSPMTQKKLTTLVTKLEDYEASVRMLQSISSSLCSDFTVFMDIYFSFRLPLMNNSMVLSTDIFTKIFNQSSDPQVQKELANYRDDQSAVFKKVLDIMCSPFTTYIDDDREALDTAVDLLLSDIHILELSMDDYKDSVTINADFYLENFLQVDIFYKELSYTRTHQQVAFEALSLFSEIGGFMGLLLGASLLTVCELLDYFLAWAVLQLRPNRENNKDGIVILP